MTAALELPCKAKLHLNLVPFLFGEAFRVQ